MLSRAFQPTGGSGSRSLKHPRGIKIKGGDLQISSVNRLFQAVAQKEATTKLGIVPKVRTRGGTGTNSQYLTAALGAIFVLPTTNLERQAASHS